MNHATPAEGGSYIKNADGTLQRVAEPTAPAVPGQGADAGPGAVVGTTQGEPPAPAEAALPGMSAARPARRK